MFAIAEAYRTGLLKPRNWYANLIAGLIVGVVALPLAMAFAIASGAKPEQGLYTAIVAAICVSLFGGSRVQIAGPTGAFIVILANITAQYGFSGLQIATLIAGFILVIFGLAKLGNIIKFIPDPVIVGFTTGIGFIIFVGEWKDFFGLPIHISLAAPFYQKIVTLLKEIPSLNLATTALACLSLCLVIVTPRVVKRLPGPLVAMVIATTLQALFHFKGIATIGSVYGSLPQHLPHLHLPRITFQQISQLIIPAFTIALLGAIESLLSATAADAMAGTRHNPNQELIGQGIANIFTPFLNGFAATGAIARTATNIRNGGTSPLAGIVHSAFLILMILFLAPLASYIPICTLAAILFVVAYNMSDISHFVYMIKRAPWYDIFVLITTFLLTVFTNLVIAVNVGVVLAIIFFIQRMNQSITIEAQTLTQLKSEFSETEIPDLSSDILIYNIQGPFYFGVAEKIEQALHASHTDPKIIIFRLKDVPFMDMTGLLTFNEIIERFHKRGVHVYLCEANNRLLRKLTNVGIINLISEKRILTSLREILTANSMPTYASNI